MYVCTFARLYVCTFVCLYVRKFVCLYVCTFVCLYTILFLLELCISGVKLSGVHLRPHGRVIYHPTVGSFLRNSQRCANNLGKVMPSETTITVKQRSPPLESYVMTGLPLVSETNTTGLRVCHKCKWLPHVLYG